MEKELQEHKINAFNREKIAVTAANIETHPGPGPGPGYVGEYKRCDDYHIFVKVSDSELVETRLKFQHGPIADGINGITDEALIAVVLDRVRYFQTSPYKCRQNALAITKLEEAMHWLRDRAREREGRGVEGTHTP